MCEYGCHQIGGPWIAENPNCPIHGEEGQQKERRIFELENKVEELTNKLNKANAANTQLLWEVDQLRSEVLSNSDGWK